VIYAERRDRDELSRREDCQQQPTNPAVVTTPIPAVDSQKRTMV